VKYVIIVKNNGKANRLVFDNIAMAKNKAAELNKQNKQVECFTEIDLQGTIHDYKR
jgi:hypothetical protein